MATGANESCNPHELREHWRHMRRERQKQRICADFLTAAVRAIEEEAAGGNQNGLIPDYGPDVQLSLIVEALRDGLSVCQTAEQVLVQFEQDAYRAFAAAVQQN